MKKFFFLILTTSFLVPSFAQQKSDSLTIKDKAQIVESVLKDENLPNRGLIVGEKNDGNIFLSKEEIVSVPLPKIEGINFILLNRKQIKQKNLKYGFYMFTPFIQEGEYIEISFGRFFNPNKKFDGEGTTYKCKRLSQWTCWKVGGFSRSEGWYF